MKYRQVQPNPNANKPQEKRDNSLVRASKVFNTLLNDLNPEGIVSKETVDVASSSVGKQRQVPISTSNPFNVLNSDVINVDATMEEDEVDETIDTLQVENDNASAETVKAMAEKVKDMQVDNSKVGREGVSHPTFSQ